MRRYPIGIAAAAAIVAIAGCSSGGDDGPKSAQPTLTTPTSPAPGAVEVSPNGVTTAIGAPAESTETEYFQACRAAKEWMDQQGGDPKSQIEPYLATLQAPGAQPGPATFDTPWSQLSPARQAAVIVAVQAGADALCG
ncbi:MAG: lipoprotein LpqV [Mycobacterium sp.]